MPIRLLLISLFVISIGQPTYAGGLNYLAGSRQAGLSYAAITSSTHWATFYNQAGLAGVDKFSFGLTAERKFGLKSLNAGALSLAIPVKNAGTIGLSVYQFSHGSYYNQQKYGLAFSRKFGENVSAGLQFDAFNTHIREYGSRWLITGEAGLLFQPDENIEVGLHVMNPTAQGDGNNFDDIAPPTGNLGASYRFSQKATWYMAVEKNVKHTPRFKSGLAYNPLDKLQLQAGIATEPLNYSFGIRYRWQWLTVNLAFSFHQQLGMTPYLGTNYMPE